MFAIFFLFFVSSKSIKYLLKTKKSDIIIIDGTAREKTYEENKKFTFTHKREIGAFA